MKNISVFATVAMSSLSLSLDARAGGGGCDDYCLPDPQEPLYTCTIDAWEKGESAAFAEDALSQNFIEALRPGSVVALVGAPGAIHSGKVKLAGGGERYLGAYAGNDAVDASGAFSTVLMGGLRSGTSISDPRPRVTDGFLKIQKHADTSSATFQIALRGYFDPANLWTASEVEVVAGRATCEPTSTSR